MIEKIPEDFFGHVDLLLNFMPETDGRGEGLLTQVCQTKWEKPYIKSKTKPSKICGTLPTSRPDFLETLLPFLTPETSDPSRCGVE